MLSRGLSEYIIFYFGALVSSYMFHRGEKGIHMKLNVTEGDGFVIRCLHLFSLLHIIWVFVVANISRVTHVALNRQVVI